MLEDTYNIYERQHLCVYVYGGNIDYHLLLNTFWPVLESGRARYDFGHVSSSLSKMDKLLIHSSLSLSSLQKLL